MVAKSRHGVGRAEGDGAQHEAPVLERHTTRFRAGRQPGPLTAPVLGRSGCPTERAGRSQGRPLFQRGDVCCMQQQTGEFCADPFLSIPAVRQLSAGKGVGRSAPSSGSPKGGRTVEDFERNGCARRAREAGRRRRCIAGCAERRAGETTYARGGENARTRWSCGGARPPISRTGDARGSSSSRCP